MWLLIASDAKKREHYALEVRNCHSGQPSSCKWASLAQPNAPVKLRRACAAALPPPTAHATKPPDTRRGNPFGHSSPLKNEYDLTLPSGIRFAIPISCGEGSPYNVTM